MKTCPFCAEAIQDEAIKCRYCGSMLAEGMQSSSVKEGLDDDVRAMLAGGLKINAIKAVMERRGLGLAEAKRFVESFGTITSAQGTAEHGSGASEGSQLSLPTKTCQFCKSEIPKAASVCKNCGKNQPNPILGLIALVIAIVVGFWVYSQLGR